MTGVQTCALPILVVLHMPQLPHTFMVSVFEVCAVDMLMLNMLSIMAANNDTVFIV